MNNTKKLTFASLLTALGIVFPTLFHIFAISGTVFLPMHIPVLLCGFICGWRYGGICGIIVPIICSFTTGKPVIFPTAIAMAFELCTYGIVSGLLYKKFNVFISLISAMIVGRIVNGIINFMLLGLSGAEYSFKIFMTATFLTPLAGIIVQIIVVPIIVVILTKFELIERDV